MLTINFTPFPHLTTERLNFRQLLPEDETEIFKLRSDERVNKFLTRKRNTTLEESRAFIAIINRNISNNESVYWAITQKNNNKLIGTICIWNIQPEDYRAEIGYELSPDFWGKGFMKEAIPAIIEYAFKTLGLHSLVGDLNPNNAQSVTLLEQNGFVREGLFKESIFFNGKFSDRAVYSLLNKG